MRILKSEIIGRIELTKERENHIVINHPEIKLHLSKFKKIIKNPDEIRISRFDKNVLLFYKYFASIKNGKYIAIAVKLGSRNFVLTAYITDKIKAGERYEKEKSI